MRRVRPPRRTRRPGRSRRAVPLGAVALGAVLVLAACGSTPSPDGKASSGKGTHTVSTAMGDVSVKDRPRRVVVLDTAELDSALTLGVKPVGATRASAGQGFPDYLPKDEVSGIRTVGEIGNPNLEAIAALHPDLILSSKVRDGARYQQLKAIAPTVLSETTGYPWKANVRLHAAALGREDRADDALARYTRHAAAVTKALGGPKKAAGTSVNVVRFVEGADIRIYGKKTYIGTILADVGLGRPAITDKAKDGFSYDVSPERIDLAEADAIFTATYGDPKKAKADETLRSGLWKSLTAYRNHRVTKVDDELWLQGIGFTAAEKILDEIAARLA